MSKNFCIFILLYQMKHIKKVLHSLWKGLVIRRTILYDEYYMYVYICYHNLVTLLYSIVGNEFDSRCLIPRSLCNILFLVYGYMWKFKNYTQYICDGKFRKYNLSLNVRNNKLLASHFILLITE